MNEFLKGTRIGRIGKKKAFTLEHLPDLSGKVAIVTGASTGLGKETAIALASKGARVVIAIRENAKGEPPPDKVVKNILKASGVPDPEMVHFLELDLASLKSVKKFADVFTSAYSRLDILVNNAGISLCPYRLSEDGLELHFAVNHLGHFFLTTQLSDLLVKSAPSRVVVVSSRHHHDSYASGVRLTESEVNKTEGYDPSKGYGHSKLCNLLFMRELDRRLNDGRETKVYINAAHPGFVNASGITRHISESMGKFTYYAGRVFQSLVALSVPDGALTQVYLAASPEIIEKQIRCKYYGPIAEPYEMSALAKDDDLARRLWDFSEQLIRARTSDFKQRPTDF